MKTMLRSVAIAVLIGCLAPVASGAETAKAETTKRETFDFKFNGGTLAKMMAEIERQGGEKLNLLLPPRALNLTMPPMDFRNVTAERILMALRAFPIDNEEITFIRVSDNIWTMPSRRLPPDKTSRAYYVGHLLKKFKIQDITTAIQTTWQLTEPKVDAELKFHEETQLLIALADSKHQQAIVNVLEELKKAVAPDEVDSRKPEPEAKPTLKK